MTAATMLRQLQWQQLQHDIAYHSDIWQLPPVRSLTHMTLHQTKYLGALAQALPARNAQALHRTLTDAFVITLATANILNQDLSTLAPAHIDDFGALGCVVSRSGAAGCDVFDANAVLARYATLCGAMAKACEAFDHGEDYPSRKELAKSNAAMCRLVIGLAAAHNIDLPTSYQERIAGVELKSVFNAQIKAAQSAAPARKTPTQRRPRR